MELEAGPEMALKLRADLGLDTITKPTVLPWSPLGLRGCRGHLRWSLGSGGRNPLTGAAVNTYRLIFEQGSGEDSPRVFALVAAAAGGYMAYKAFGRKGNSNDRQ